MDNMDHSLYAIKCSHLDMDYSGILLLYLKGWGALLDTSFYKIGSLGAQKGPFFGASYEVRFAAFILPK